MSKELNAELAQLVKNAREALSAAERFADLHKLSFYWNPAYGLGGSYIGDPDERWNSDYSDDGWHSSSMGC